MIEALSGVPARVLQGTAHNASVTFTGDGVELDPGAVTVSVEREDGTELAADQPADGSGQGSRTFELDVSWLAALDALKLTWVSPDYGSLVSYVEIVGGFLFSVTDARSLRPLDNTLKYGDTAILTARTLAETALEDACGVAFVPRYARERLDGTGDVDLLLPHPRPLSVQAATMGGTDIAPLSDLEPYKDERLYYPSKWNRGRRNVTVKYTHGYATPPPRVGRACLMLAKRFLVDSPIDDRVIQHTNEDGVSQLYMTAGVRGQVFDVPECVAVVEEYGYPGSIA